MERASAARMAAAKPHGWVHAALGMGDTGYCADKLNNYDQILKTSFPSFTQARVNLMADGKKPDRGDEGNFFGCRKVEIPISLGFPHHLWF